MRSDQILKTADGCKRKNRSFKQFQTDPPMQPRMSLRSPYCAGSIAGPVYSTRGLSIAAPPPPPSPPPPSLPPPSLVATAAAVDRIAGAIGRRMVVAGEPAKNASSRRCRHNCRRPKRNHRATIGLWRGASPLGSSRGNKQATRRRPQSQRPSFRLSWLISPPRMACRKTLRCPNSSPNVAVPFIDRSSEMWNFRRDTTARPLS